MVVSQPRSHVGGVAVRHVYSYFMTCSAGLAGRLAGSGII